MTRLFYTIGRGQKMSATALWAGKKRMQPKIDNLLDTAGNACQSTPSTLIGVSAESATRLAKLALQGHPLIV
jgi:hypothetical protein